MYVCVYVCNVCNYVCMCVGGRGGRGGGAGGRRRRRRRRLVSKGQCGPVGRVLALRGASWRSILATNIHASGGRSVQRADTAAATHCVVAAHVAPERLFSFFRSERLEELSLTSHVVTERLLTGSLQRWW